MILLLKLVLSGMFFAAVIWLCLIQKNAKTMLLKSREVFQCRVLLCLWHVRRAWMRSLLKKCCNLDVQQEMFKHLGQILYCTKNRPIIVDAIQEFMQIFVDQCAFMNYFRRRWLPRIGIFLLTCLYLPHKISLCPLFLVLLSS